MSHKPRPIELDRELSELWGGFSEPAISAEARYALQKLGEAPVPSTLRAELYDVGRRNRFSIQAMFARPFPIAFATASALVIALLLRQPHNTGGVSELSERESQEIVAALEEYDLSRSLAFNVFDHDLTLMEGTL